jgi:hypothetical protein
VPATERVFWRNADCTVWVSYNEAGELVFTGEDRAYLDGYEYWVAVPPHQFDRVRAILGAGRDADVLDLVCAHVDDIMALGERSWLDHHGIERRFGSY